MSDRKLRRPIVDWVCAMATLAFLVGCERVVPAVPSAGAGPGSGQVGDAAAAPAAVESLYLGCVQAMLQSTCKVENDRSGPSQGAATVFVAGVGPVDAASYRQLRESGEAMCSQVRQQCTAAWDGPPCVTARALWSSVSAATPRR